VKIRTRGLRHEPAKSKKRGRGRGVGEGRDGGAGCCGVRSAACAGDDGRLGGEGVVVRGRDGAGFLQGALRGVHGRGDDRRADRRGEDADHAGARGGGGGRGGDGGGGGAVACGALPGAGARHVVQPEREGERDGHVRGAFEGRDRAEAGGGGGGERVDEPAGVRRTGEGEDAGAGERFGDSEVGGRGGRKALGDGCAVADA